MSDHPEREEDALQRIERRLANVEQRLARMERVGRPVDTPAAPASRPPPLPRPPEPAPAPEPVRKSPSPSAAAPAAPAAPSTPRPPAPAREPSAARTNVLAALDKAGLRPPGPRGNLEVQLGTWWATRIGALLAVICVVFFGVYVSRNAAPLLRFCELLAASAGMAIAGLWLERRYEKFGGVVFAGGLALLYFTAFAAFAVQPVRIIQSETLACWVQFAAVAGIVLCALWRGSSAIATMALFFGYIACFFSFFEQLHEFALTANFLLGAAGCLLYAGRRWPQPFRLAIPLTYLTYAVVAVWGWIPSHDVTFPRAMGHILAYMVLFGLTDYVALKRKTVMAEGPRMFIHILSSTAAVALGYVVTRELFMAELPVFYFLFGGILVLASIGYYLLGMPNALMHAYFIKGTGLVAVGLAVILGGWQRWTALALQSGVLLVSARRTRLKIIEAAMGAVWLGSFYFFVQTMRISGYLQDPGELLSRDAAVGVGYLVFSAVILALRARWFRHPGRALLTAKYLVYSLMLGTVALLLGFGFAPEVYQGATLAGLAVILFATAWLTRHWLPTATGCFPLAAAHLTTWFSWGPAAQTQVLWTNGAAAMLATLGLAFFAWHHGRGRASRRFAVADGALHTLWILTLLTLLARTLGDDPTRFAFALASLVLALAAARVPFRVLSDLSALPLAAVAFGALLFWVDRGAPAQHVSIVPLRWLTAGAALLYACAFSTWPFLHRRQPRLAGVRTYQWPHMAIAVVLVLDLVATAFPPQYAVPALATVAVLFLAPLRMLKLVPAAAAVVLFLVAAHLGYYASAIQTPPLVDVNRLWPFLATAALSLAVAVLVRRMAPWMPRRTELRFRWLGGGLALVLLLALFHGQAGPLQPYISVCWGLSAIVVFLAGLIDRSGPLRILGLVGLAVCIPRVFIVDIHSALHRIAAFGALGVVLLLVGFLYHRFRHLVEIPPDE